ncbi:hypothetical protein F5Y09DRAFT_322570 [Xylaria sp. FL1042]|nr:hypothetical protein F5Y09DRAFT_322570 [Xylaria sp. FL1042]
MLQPLMSPPMHVAAEAVRHSRRRHSDDDKSTPRHSKKDKHSSPHNKEPATTTSGGSRLKRAVTKAIQLATTPKEHKNTTTTKTADEGAARAALAQDPIATQCAAYVEARRASLRAEAISSGSMAWPQLRELAGYEEVWLGPRMKDSSPSSSSSSSPGVSSPSAPSNPEGQDFSLAPGIVARVSGRRRKANDGFVFLGSDRCLYVGRHPLGRDAEKIPPLGEDAFGEFREISRAYYQLCGEKAN